jgi:hypothetical protein
VSINIDRILKFKGLPERALETVLMLLSVVLGSVIGLIPGQSHVALAAELLGKALLFGAVIVVPLRRSLPPRSVDRGRGDRLDPVAVGRTRRRCRIGRGLRLFVELEVEAERDRIVHGRQSWGARWIDRRLDTAGRSGAGGGVKREAPAAAR